MGRADPDARDRVDRLGAHGFVGEREQTLGEVARRRRGRVVERDGEDTVITPAQLEPATGRDESPQAIERGSDGDLAARRVRVRADDVRFAWGFRTRGVDGSREFASDRRATDPKRRLPWITS